MNAGSLRHVVTIQQPIEAQQPDGQLLKTWQDVITTNAAIAPVTAREYFRAPQFLADVTHKVTLRFWSGITPKMRVMFGTRALNIFSVINRDERSIELDLLCKEVV